MGQEGKLKKKKSMDVFCNSSLLPSARILIRTVLCWMVGAARLKLEILLALQ